jgi:hypothetical protein
MSFATTIQVSDTKKKKNYTSKPYLNRKKNQIKPVHNLQNSIGNQAVNKMINNKTILTKLKDTHTKNPFGSVADNVETRVMQKKNDLEKTKTEDEIQTITNKNLMRQEEQEQVQLQPYDWKTKPPESPGSQRDHVVPGKLDSDIKNMQGKGTPLDTKTRKLIEPRLGFSLENVRIHTPNTGSKLNRKINSNAFTHGNEIFLNKKAYPFQNKKGKNLLIHELTHVIQQPDKQGDLKVKPTKMQQTSIQKMIARSISTLLSEKKVNDKS